MKKNNKKASAATPKSSMKINKKVLPKLAAAKPKATLKKTVTSFAKAKTLAKGLVKGLAGSMKAMAPKSVNKKSQTKVPPTKPAPAPAKNLKKAAPAPVVTKTAAAPAKLMNKSNQKVPPTKPLMKGGKTPPVKEAPVVAVLTKNKSGDAQASVKGVTTKVVAAKAAGKGKGAKYNANSFSDANNEKMCRENACENVATTKGYCRLDYIKNWKKIKRKEMILKEGKLNQYIEELVGKYPDKYIDIIRQDLSTEVNFNKVIHDLELDESIDDLDYDGDSIDSLIGSIRKDGEGFDGDDDF